MLDSEKIAALHEKLTQAEDMLGKGLMQPPGHRQNRYFIDVDNMCRLILEGYQGGNQHVFFRAVNLMAQAQAGLGIYENAIHLFEILIEQVSKLKPFEPSILNLSTELLCRLGDVCLLGEKDKKAEFWLKQGLADLPLTSEFNVARATLYEGLARVNLENFKFKKAFIYALLAVKKAKVEKNSTRLLAHCQSTLAQVASRCGQNEVALQNYLDSLAILHSTSSTSAHELAGQHGNIATTLTALGNYQRAIHYLNKAIQISKESGDNLGYGRWLDSLGVLYQFLGRYEEAKRYHQEALDKLTLDASFSEEMMLVRQNIGLALLREGVQKSENRLLQQASLQFESILKDISSNPKFRREVSITQGNLGLAKVYTGELDTARKLFHSTIDNLKYLNLSSDLSFQFDNLGQLYGMYLNSPQQALDYFDRALLNANAYQQLEVSRRIYINRAELYRSLKQFERAKADYLKAVNLIESESLGWGNLVLFNHRIGLLERNIKAYEGLIHICWSNGDLKEAFEWSEKARARVFLEQIGLVSSSIGDIGGAFIDEERKIVEKIRKAEGKVRQRLPDFEKRELERQLEEYTQQLQNLWTKIEDEKKGQSYVAFRKGKPVKAKALEAWLNRQKKQTAILVFYCFPTHICSWLFIKKKPLASATFLLDKEQAESYTEIYSNEISDYKSPIDWNSFFAPLLSLLCEYIDNIEKLYIVPHSFLHIVAFHALKLKDKFLIEHTAVAYLPSVSIFPYLTRKNLKKAVQKRVKVIGFTESPEQQSLFKASLKKASFFFNTNYQFQPDHTLDNLSEDIDIVFIICHGRFDKTESLNSCLLFSPPLTGYDLLNLDVKGATIILAACDVGKSIVTRSDEPSGLAHAFLLAGASTVIAASWPIEVESALRLLEIFYKRWQSKQNPFSIANSLREAMLSLRKNENTQHPYFWAPFKIIGDVH